MGLGPKPQPPISKHQAVSTERKALNLQPWIAVMLNPNPETVQSPPQTVE